jgi:hypothetical protein
MCAAGLAPGIPVVQQDLCVVFGVRSVSSAQADRNDSIHPGSLVLVEEFREAFF